MTQPIRTSAIVTIALALTACGQTQTSEPATRPAEATPSAPVKRQPGSWKMLHYTIAFDAENVEGGMAEMVKAGKSSVGKKEFGGPLCLFAELAGKDDLTTRLNEAIRFGPEWKVSKSGVKNGKVDFAATMDDPVQGKGAMTITGIITPTTTDLLVTTDVWQPAPGKGHIHTVMKQENTRAGECTPGQDASN